MKYTDELERIIKTYGKHALVSMVNNYNLIHLDNPSDEQIKERIKEAANGHMDDDLDDDCPLCQMLKGKRCDVVYIDYDNVGDV